MAVQKHLLILTDTGMGGITTAAQNMCTALLRKGHEVHVLVMDDACEIPASLFGNAKIFRLHGKAGLWNLGMPKIKKEKNPLKKAYLYVMGLLKKRMNQSDKWKQFVFSSVKNFSGYDDVLAYRQNAACYYFALHCTEAKKKIAFVHGDVAYMQGNEASFLKYMPLFDAVAYVSNGVKAGFIQKYPSLTANAATVYNFFDAESILLKSHQECDTVFDKDIVNIITVSRLENITKGIRRICPVCKALHDRFPGKFRWYVIGDGEEKAACINECHALGLDDCLFFLGRRDNPYPYLKQADVCVLPSKTEAFPMVVCESLLLHIPVIICAYPAANEQIVPGLNGLIAQQNEQSLLDTISTVFDGQTLHELKERTATYLYDNDLAYRQLLDLL